MILNLDWSRHDGLMTMSYQELHEGLRQAADAASSALAQEPGTFNDLGQSSIHLATVVSMLDDIDPEQPEEPTREAALSRAAAIARASHDHAIDDGPITSELEALNDAVTAVEEAGYIGEQPDSLEYFNGDFPADGSSWD